MKTTYYERPGILARPELEQGHTIIEASAGTGKTFTLEHLVLDLIINDRAKIEEILVVTFTDAATRELRERVRALIRKACDEGEEKIPDGNPEVYWKIDQTTRGRLRDALFRFDGAAISTIHGFCQRILSEQAFLSGRLFEQEHGDGKEMFGLSFREEIRTALVEEGLVGASLRLWVEQDNRLEELEKLLYDCHREGCPDRCPVTPLWDPEGFIGAAGELPPLDDLKAAGPNLFSNQRTREGFENHLEELFNAISGIEELTNPLEAISLFIEWASFKRSLAGEKGPQIDNLRRAAEMTGAPEILRELAKKLDEMEQRAAPAGSFFVYQLLPRIQERLAARKQALGLIDYDDMLLGVQEALRGDGAKVLLDSLRKRWKYALVDEFQDTDPVQWDIFRRIFVEETREHRLFVIGDPKQAIYGFRGADVHTYEVAKKYLIGQCNASRVALTYNYRSTEPLIDSINEILTIKDEQGSDFFDGLNSYDEPVQSGDKSLAAWEAGKPAVPVQLIHLHGGEKELNASTVKWGTACFIGEEIKKLIGEEGLMVADSKNKVFSKIKLSDIYILTRSAREGQLIGRALRNYGIPHAFYKQDGLFQTDEAHDVHRLLNAINTPTEPGTRMSAWLTPFFDVPLVDLPDWRDAGESHPLTGLLLEWKQLAETHAWSRLFDQIINGSGIVRRLIFAGNERALTNYLHLFELLQAEAYSRPVSLTELNRNLKARIDQRKLPEGREGNVQRLETDKEAVQILTMHKAKGLEAEVVFIGGGFGNYRGGGLETNIYHQDNERRLHIGKATGEIDSAIKQETIEENQRLLYVSMTRAKSRLYLPYFGEAPDDAPPERSYGYKRLGDFYKALQKQLDLLRSKDRLEDHSHFKLREASCLKKPPPEQSGWVDLTDWPTDQNLLEIPASSAPEAAQIKPRHRGVLLTSYTRIKRGINWQAPDADVDDQAARRNEEVAAEAETDQVSLEEMDRNGTTGPAGIERTRLSWAGSAGGSGREKTLPAEGEAAGDSSAAPELPGGREAGIFLHALIENIPFDEINNRSFEAWTSMDQAWQQAKIIARRHGFSEQYLPSTLRLVYDALRTPIEVQNCEKTNVLEMPGGIASGTNHRMEMSFVYPIPEAFHPLLAINQANFNEAGALPFQVLRGYVQGLIDITFEHEEKFYLLDWKSDRLSAFDQTALKEHVEANYNIQARLYTLAVVRLLGIKTKEDYETRFGGILYAFMRGIRKADENSEAQEGIWYSQPTWNEITSWEQALVSREEWGGQVIKAD